MLELQKITSPLSAGYALRAFNQELIVGECVGLYGPNGCGKTTLLHLLAGVVRQRTGRILLGRSTLSHSLSRNFAKGVVLFPQGNPHTAELSFRQLTELVASQMRRLRCSDTYVGQDAEHFLNAGADGDSRLGNLSYGECRSASLRLWMSLNPRLLLLDEPFAGLNEKLVSGLLHEIKLASAKCVTFLVDHNCERLRSICSSVWHFERGEICQRSVL